MKFVSFIFAAAALVSLVTADETPFAEFKGVENIVDTWQETGKPILVAHTATWCGHCQALKPNYEEAAKQVDSVIFMNVNCPDHEEYCADMLVRGFPTIKYFNGAWHDFQGERTTEAIVEFANSIADTHEEWDGKYTLRGSIELEEDDFVEPVDAVTGPRWEEMSFAKLEQDAGPKIVIFGDVREEKTQEVYKIVDAVIAEKEAVWPHPVKRVERRREQNSEIFDYPAFNNLPIMFFVAGDSPSPRFFDGELTAESISAHIDDITAPFDFEQDVTMFKTGADLAKIVAETDKPVFAAFLASWCPHCRDLKPVLARTAAKQGDVGTIAAIMCDEDEAGVCGKMHITGYPSVFVFDGADFTKYEGARSPAALLEVLRNTPVKEAVAADPIEAYDQLMTAEEAEETYEVEDVADDEVVEEFEVEDVEEELEAELEAEATVADKAKEVIAVVKAKADNVAAKAVGLIKDAKEAVGRILEREPDNL